MSFAPYILLTLQASGSVSGRQACCKVALVISLSDNCLSLLVPGLAIDQFLWNIGKYLCLRQWAHSWFGDQ